MTTNPDLDEAFFDFYKETCDHLQTLLHASGSAYILGGEGILGLEAACASLTEAGDRVLVLNNGIFGKGFADFVSMYGGEPVLFTSDYHNPIDVEALRAYLAARLEPYKVPRRIVLLPALPRTYNGKLDYKALRGNAQN